MENEPKQIKMSEALALGALVFAKNFSAPAGEKELENLAPNWFIKTENPENERGAALLKTAAEAKDKAALAAAIKADFEAFAPKFELDSYGYIGEKKVEAFYEKIKFKKPFATLRASHASNMLALLAVIFRQDKDEATHNALGMWLADFVLPSAFLLARDLAKDAKSEYYMALGEFMADHFKHIKSALGLRAEFE